MSIRRLVEHIDAEKVVIAITYNKDSWWARRGKGHHPFSVEVEWEDHGEKFQADGHVNGVTVAAVLTAVEAEVNGSLLRRRGAATRAEGDVDG